MNRPVDPYLALAGCRGSASGHHLSKASLAFSPACLRLLLVWSVLPLRSIFLSPVALPACSLAAPWVSSLLFLSLSSQPISGPPSLSVVVLASADGASHGSEDPKDHTNHQKYAPYGHQHGDSRDESHDQKHHSENDHLSFLFFLGGRPFCMNSQRRTFNEQRHYGDAGTDDGRGTDQRLDTKRLTLMSGNAMPPCCSSGMTGRAKPMSWSGGSA